MAIEKVREYFKKWNMEDRILEFESGLFEYISTKYPDIFEKIRKEKKLSDELEDALKKAITEFKETF